MHFCIRVHPSPGSPMPITPPRLAAFRFSLGLSAVLSTKYLPSPFPIPSWWKGCHPPRRALPRCGPPSTHSRVPGTRLTSCSSTKKGAAAGGRRWLQARPEGRHRPWKSRRLCWQFPLEGKTKIISLSNSYSTWHGQPIQQRPSWKPTSAQTCCPTLHGLWPAQNPPFAKRASRVMGSFLTLPFLGIWKYFQAAYHLCYFLLQPASASSICFSYSFGQWRPHNLFIIE